MGFGRFMPREERFFDCFERNATNLVAGARLLVDALDHPDTLDAHAARLTEVEHWADEITHQVMAALNRTFVTPLDREDIAGLANALDDVLDLMDVALRRMVLFKLRTASPAAQALAHTVLAQVEAIDRAVPLLRRRESMARVQEHLVEINRLENQGDRQLEQALAALYGDDPDLPALIEGLKWKEVYELLEVATDRAEDVADVLESIVLKNT
jgi:predicted phosphate transport protein (TIGR00153 family)